MNSRITVIIIIIFITIILPVVAYLTIVNNAYTGNFVNSLISPGGTKAESKSVEGEEISLPEAPKTFKFDRTTDLKVELEKINPKVLDSDFE